MASSKIKVCLLLATYKTREARPMMMFNSYIFSKLDYYSLIWSPHKKEDFDKKLKNTEKFYKQNQRPQIYGLLLKSKIIRTI